MPKQKHIYHTPRHAAKKSHKLKTFFAILLTMIIVLLISGGSVALYALNELKSSVETITISLPPEDPKYTGDIPDAEIRTLDGEFTMLVVGSDSRDGQQVQDGEESELNDVTMLLKINEDHTKMDVISFPRDLVVPYECVNPATGYTSGYSDKMINAALTHGGMSCVAKTITEITGETIDSAVMVNFDSVIHLTNAIGGVPICFTAPVYNTQSPYQEMMFHEGENNLIDTGALAFLRERKSMGNGGDLDRIGNQQLFLKAFLNKVQSDGTLTDPIKLYKLARITVDNLTLTEELTNPDNLISLANTVSQISFDNITFHTAPNYTHPDNINRLALDQYGLDQLMLNINGIPTEAPVEQLPTETPVPETPTEAPVEQTLLESVEYEGTFFTKEKEPVLIQDNSQGVARLC